MSVSVFSFNLITMELSDNVLVVKIGQVIRFSPDHILTIKRAKQCMYQTWFDINEDKRGLKIAHVVYIVNGKVFISGESITLVGNSLYSLLSYYAISRADK